MTPGWIVVPNGAPRSGKSSVADVIQETFDGPWLNLGVDVSRNGTRRFCSTACQNRVKAAAFRERQKTGP